MDMVEVCLWVFKWTLLSAGSEPKPSKRDTHKVTNRVVTSVVFDELHDVGDALFGVKVFEL